MKKTATSKGPSRKLKVKKETLKDLNVPSGRGVKGGMATGNACQLRPGTGGQGIVPGTGTLVETGTIIGVPTGFRRG